MIFHSVGEIKRVFSYLSDDLELTEDGLRTFLAPHLAKNDTLTVMNGAYTRKGLLQRKAM